MRTSIRMSLPAWLGFAVALANPGSASAQVPTRSSEPRLVIPTSAATAPTAGQPTTNAAAPGSVTQFTGNGGVQTLPDSTNPNPSTASSSQAVMASSGYAATSSYLEVGSPKAPVGTYVRSASGGEPVAEVVDEGGSGAVHPKHLGEVHYTDIVAEVKPGEFTDLIAGFLRGQSAGFDGRLVGLDYRNTARFQTGFRGATLTGLEFPAMDGAARETGYLTLHLTPESSRPESPGSVPSSSTMSSKQRPWYRNGFTLAVSGLEAKRVTRIEPFAIRTNSSADQAGETRYASKQGAMGWGLLTVTFAAVDAQSWLAWRDNFMVAGNNGASAEKSLTLTLYSSDMSKTLLVLTGSGVGIAGLRQVPSTNTESVAKYQADLYVEQWDVSK